MEQRKEHFMQQADENVTRTDLKMHLVMRAGVSGVKAEISPPLGA